MNPSMPSLENYKDILPKNKWKVLGNGLTFLWNSILNFLFIWLLHKVHILGGRILRLGPSQGWKGQPFIMTLISMCKVCTTSFLASLGPWRWRWTETKTRGLILRFLIFSRDKTSLYLMYSCIYRVRLFFPDILIIKPKLKKYLLTVSSSRV